MRYSDTHKEQTHARIVAGAAERLREAGVNGIGVADLMRAAGLTHGGFYAHFESKEQLVAESISTAMGQTIARLRAAGEAVPKAQARKAVAESYLSAAHRDHAEKGCTIAVLGADVARLTAPTKAVFESRLEELVALLEEVGGGRGESRPRAIAMLSTMVGALVMARAVKSKGLSEEILQVAREAVA